jgi:hypothetical protein
MFFMNGSFLARGKNSWVYGVMNQQLGVHGGSKVLIDGNYCDRGTQTLVVADNPHFLTHLLILTLIPSFLHFLTVPDNTSSSERDGIHIGAHE